jgi:hypothetical protein
MNLNILDVKETINYLIENNCSITRFGDGEIVLMKNKSIYFQNANKLLSEELINIIENGTNSKCLVAIACNNKHSYKYQKKKQKYWKNFENNYCYKFFLEKINKNSIYGSACITRLGDFDSDTFDIENYKKHFFKLFKPDKEYIFISNEKLCNKIKSLKIEINFKDFIIIPEKDAYQKKNEIIDNIYKFGNSYIYLICAGPTATIIAYQLSQQNYIILDLGHFFNFL